eukprot:TRINITY_DN9032_c0_g1_i1.p1 TRINITY_DN9032_c0_g1~~TRINITY_DN9032_c0_g1_i1.p1  ORF type:complete len:149 (+),score=4.11 TRINITY_DN9032_c0_g1_i1:134-580(+)
MIPSRIAHISILPVSIITFLLFIAGLALAGQNKDGVNFNGEDLKSTDVHASFGIIACIMGIISIFWVWGLWSKNNYTSSSVAAWVFWAAFTLWWLCGIIGIWCYTIDVRDYPRSWSAELGVDILASFSLIILIVCVVSTLKTYKITTK